MPKKISRKFPKINSCYPQNESNKKFLFLFRLFFPVHTETHSFKWQGGLCLYFASQCYFWSLPTTLFLSLFLALMSLTRRARLLHARGEKRVFVISEINIFHFLPRLFFGFWERNGKANVSNFRYPPCKCIGMCCHLCVLSLASERWCAGAGSSWRDGLNLNPPIMHLRRLNMRSFASSRICRGEAEWVMGKWATTTRKNYYAQSFMFIEQRRKKALDTGWFKRWVEFLCFGGIKEFLFTARNQA